MSALAELGRTLADSADRATWASIPRYAGLYEASEDGRIRSTSRTYLRSDGRTGRLRGRILRPGAGTHGYLIVSLYRGGRNTKHTEQVHVLVAEAFHGPRPDGLDVMHLDADRANNAATNLRYGTRSENIRQVVAEGNHNQRSKSTCPRGHALELPNLVRFLFETRGYRECLACNRARHVRVADIGQSFASRAEVHYAAIMAVAS